MNLKMLVPLDYSANAARTIKALVAMKDKLQGSMTLLHVFSLDMVNYRGVPEVPYEMVREFSLEAAEEFIEQQKQFFLDEGMQVDTLLIKGSPRRVICHLTDSGDYDLLIIGRHTEGEFRNLLFGYVSNYVIHHAKCPLLVL